MKFKKTISGNFFSNPNGKTNLLYENPKGLGGVKMNNYNNYYYSNKANNIFQEWFTMNDKAIQNLQHDFRNADPLYKDVKKVCLFVYLAWNCFKS